ALGEGAGHAAGSGSDADIDTARDDGLQGLAAAIGVEHFQMQAMLAEYSGALTNVGNAAIPVVGGPYCKPERVLAPATGGQEHHGSQRREPKSYREAIHPNSLQSKHS